MNSFLRECSSPVSSVTRTFENIFRREKVSAAVIEGDSFHRYDRLLHGALMPLALPNLLVGRDVPIYAEHNTGRTYKLGYTAGVNGCGLLFFGFFFRRLARWRRRAGPKPHTFRQHLPASQD